MNQSGVPRQAQALGDDPNIHRPEQI